jgi:hypothetical protein
MSNSGKRSRSARKAASAVTSISLLKSSIAALL